MIIRRTHLAPENIAVIVSGFPSEVAHDVVKECRRRGFRVSRFGLAHDSIGDDRFLQIQDVGNLRLVKYTGSDVKSKLEVEMIELQKEGFFVVIADTTEYIAGIQTYIDLRIPFIIQCKEAETLLKAIKLTEAARMFAVISGHMNKRLASFDVTWTEWSKRYAGLFDGFDFAFKSSAPLETPVSLMTSFGELINKDFSSHQILDMEPETQKRLGYTQDHITREFVLSRARSPGAQASPAVRFSFLQSIDTKEAYADGFADAVAFLAVKVHRSAHPRVYNILDIAEQNPFLATPSSSSGHFGHQHPLQNSNSATNADLPPQS
jgi:hypothetical protein